MAAPSGRFKQQEVPLESALTGASGTTMFPAVPISKLVEDGYIAPHPVTARERIGERYSCELSTSGRECSGIVMLRDLVESIDADLKFARCLVVCASHTHWGDKAIVESFDPNRGLFLNGPVDQAGKLLPISFVFSLDGPIPFEWTDESVRVDEASLGEVYEFIHRLNGLVVSRLSEQLPIPLGVSIDHRFKNSIWDEQLFGYAEGYHEEEDGRAVVKPVLESIVRPDSRHTDQVQVTWSCFPNSQFQEVEFTAFEKEALLEFEQAISSLDPGQALQFVTDLEVELQARSEATPTRSTD